jgi:tetratricopeptide (TPR) repeat protein
MTELKASPSVSSLALQFKIHTAARTGEVINSQWSEISFEEKLWVIPASRMKVKAEHRVPLNHEAIKILKTLKKTSQSQYIFPGQAKSEKGLSDMAMREFMKKSTTFKDYVPHGFRSTFRDWAAETTNYPNQTVELALAHTIKNKTENKSAKKLNNVFDISSQILESKKLIQAGRLQLARALLELLPKNSISDTRQIGNLLFFIAFRERRFKDALELINHLIVVDPNNSGDFNNQGLVFKEAGDFNSAILSFDKAIKIDPNKVADNRNC